MLKNLPTTKSPLTILQVSALDRAGGAEQVAWGLFERMRKLGVRSWMSVGKKRSHDPQVLVISQAESDSWWSQLCNHLAALFNPLAGKVRGILRFQAFLKRLGQGSDYIAQLRGMEDFHFPGSWQILEQVPEKPALVHLHNLHGGYFDPRSLEQMSAQVPVMLTLHDAWLLSGNCAHSFSCERWKTGCGKCPDISIYPGLKVDSTHLNWLRKKKIFEHSKLYIASPCQWLLNKVNESILAPAVIESRVIPNGVDTSIFYPRNQSLIREELKLPLHEPVLLFVANGIKANSFKDYSSLREVVKSLGQTSELPLHFIALGEDAEPEHLGNATIHYIPRTTDMHQVAKYYQAADIYLHPAKAETFPTAILEAMACGLPVIASDVGGISEQVDDGITGLLIPSQNPDLMAKAASALMSDIALRKKMGAASVQKVQEHFTLERQTQQYLNWYQEILGLSQ
mgnify:CR=1 FL=1